MSEELTRQELKSLDTHEEVIERGLGTFYEVGSALVAIRDDRLYRQTHDTFEDYCRERWDMGRNYVNKLITATEVRNSLGTIVPILPANEAQARPLASVPEDERAEVWNEVVESAPKDDEGNPLLTAKHVKSIVTKTKSGATMRIKLDDLEHTRIFQQFIDGKSIKSLASEYGVNRHLIMKANNKAREEIGHPPAMPSETISEKALIIRRDIRWGVACSSETQIKYGLDSSMYSRAVAVAVSGNNNLVNAMDTGLLAVCKANSLLKKSDKEIEDAIIEVEAEREREAIREVTCNGKTSGELLMSLLSITYDRWGGFEQTVTINSKMFQKKERLQEATHLSRTVRELVMRVLDSLDKEIKSCSRKTARRKTS